MNQLKLQGSHGQNLDSWGRGEASLHEASSQQGAVLHGGQGGRGRPQVQAEELKREEPIFRLRM